MKKLLRLLFSRAVIVSLLILFQLALLFLAAVRFTEYFVFYYILSTVFAVILTLTIVSRKDGAEYKIAWLVTVLLIPVFGGLLYLIFGGNRMSEHKKRKMARINEATRNTLKTSESPVKQISEESPSAGFQSRYIENTAVCPPFGNTEVKYFPLGDDMFPALLEELERAEKYIFLEYFIIDEGRMWNTILDILKRKAAAGVDVRVIYDDMGCIMMLPRRYARQLQEYGIRCHVFNRYIPVLNARLNNRDHRKIGIIDGKVAFTGGVNLADEYINEKNRFGHWKDNAVMLRGDAAWSMTVMFLAMWDYLDKAGAAAESYEHYRPKDYGAPVSDVDGWVQPYTDNPLDNEPVGQTIYLNMINRAERYVYIMTPYLIIDGQLEAALCNAARGGVDVRIMMPGVGDKFIVYETSKSYYENLIRHGVKIYEYAPGFLHAKTFICDDKYATVGTVNLDFRSLYLHFECGVWMYRTAVIEKIKADFEDTFRKCREIRLEDCQKSLVRELFRAVMALIAPMI